MKSFSHFNARAVGEAIELLNKYKGKAKLNAGGTDLLGILKDGVLPGYPEAIINIKSIPGLDYIKEDAQGLRIGALATLASVARSPGVREKYPVLAEAAHAVASPQIRNMGTLGGNLCQDVRCWYYRYPNQIGGRNLCLRKGSGPCQAVSGDNRYHAIMGGKGCFAVCSSDCAVALAALNARVTLAGPEGDRVVRTVDFFKPLGNACAPGEILTEIQVPKPPDAAKQVFRKLTLRKPIDFAIVSVALVVAMGNGLCQDVCIALGAIAPMPIRATRAEQILVGRGIDEARAAEAAAAAVAGAKPLGMNAYKVVQTRVLLRRALLEMGPDAT